MTDNAKSEASERFICPFCKEMAHASTKICDEPGVIHVLTCIRFRELEPIEFLAVCRRRMAG